jgi:hypothetical protein
MPKNSLKDELVQACKAAPPAGDGEKIAAGRTMWFEGKAAPAEAGTLALDTPAGTRIIVREKDARTVETSDRGYLIEVAEGTDMLVRVEKVVKAEATSCGCDEGQLSQERMNPTSIWIKACTTEVRYVCRFVTDARGVGRVICIPYVTQECNYYQTYAPF